jgi:hypothetical protein
MRGAVVLAVVWCLSTSELAVTHAQGSPEYDVKAAFLLNFTRYVEWPPAQRTTPFRLCLFRDDPFGARLQAIVKGEQWQGGEMRVDVVASLGGASNCHLLYVPASANRRFERDAADVAASPMLIVGEDDQFLERGGMIRLFIEDQKVRFSINQKAAQSAGLQISSRLLRLARSVIGVTST